METGVKFLTRKRDSFLPHCLSIVLTNVLSKVYIDYFPPVLDWPEREPTNFPLPSVKVGNG